MRRLSFFLFALLSAPLLPAQAPNPAEQKEAMQKLDFMIGEWEGEGWMDRGGQRATFKGGEIVQAKLNGIALLVEGKFKAPVQGEDRTVHETLGILTYDPAKKSYRFRTHLAMGASGDHELTLLDGGWRWSLQGPQGQMRYTMKLNEKGEWFEIGERSTDGEKWEQFFEMTLRKKT